ncbi:hypothetical protein Cni_G20759 [Canna indica]|uniref:Cytochrome P450 n=1 Tax=Canna indica TaxID=4628 RepID=A0AAQ3KNQ6_9LILI|nr:hypothetical protein Cni_G20759 [Canna indica]
MEDGVFEAHVCRDLQRRSVLRRHHRDALSLLALLRKVATTGESVDLQEVFLRFTFDNTCTAAFGVDPGCLSVDLLTVPFAKAFEGATKLSMFPFHRVALRVEDEAFRCWHGEAAQGSYQGHVQLCRGNRGEPTDGFRELQRLEIRQPLRPPLKIDQIRNHFYISFILAGHDTISVPLAWFFWLLSKHRHVEEHIVHEISMVIKSRHEDETTHALGDVVFTVDELKRMEYLQAAISESLRLYPSMPIDFKEALEDDVFPDGMMVKKGARVIYSIYSMARMESIRGKDCREFKPKRWIKYGVFVTKSQFKYAMFNVGPRLRIG